MSLSATQATRPNALRGIDCGGSESEMTLGPSQQGRERTERAIFENLSVLFVPGQVVELRAFKKGGHPVRGFFDDLHALARFASTLSGNMDSVHMTLNPVDPSLLETSLNHISGGNSRATSDDDIVERRWLMIDLDPVRPSGTSSTDEEHDQAFTNARAIAQALCERDWPAPIIADSGNGAHLLYRIQLPNDRDARSLIDRVLTALDLEFSSDQVTVDTVTGNSSRPAKLYGSLVKKGEHTPKRRHRYSQIVEVPEHLAVVSEQLLDELASRVPMSAIADLWSDTDAGIFDVEAWLIRYGLKIVRSEPWKQSGRKLVLEKCPWNSKHDDRSAFVVQFPNGAVAAGCHHNGCNGKDWRALRDMMEPGWKDHSHPNTVSVRLPSGEPDHEESQETEPWPTEPSPEIYQGLIGEIVHFLDPTTEADPIGVLLTLMAAIGNLVGPGPHWRVSGRDHGLRIFALLVGPTGHGRKGTAWSTVEQLLAPFFGDWLTHRVKRGLSSGEGLIHAVHEISANDDDQRREWKVKEKRLLVIEEEFGSVLKMMTRRGNTLDSVIRQAWDDGNLSTLTKNSPTKAVGAHITILGHITIDELQKRLTSDDIANGFANRFTPILVSRSKLLPDGGEPRPDLLNEFAGKLANVMANAQSIDLMRRDDLASEIWRDVYAQLSEREGGLAGAVLGRAEAQVMRIACIYAICDESDLIRLCHLEAALALWRYVEESVRTIFSKCAGDPLAETIFEKMKAAGGTMNRTEIGNSIGRHAPRGRVDAALNTLRSQGKLTVEVEQTKGRSRQTWRAVNQ